ncbi:YccF domain-containing protein, partial [Haloquadratum walsbyi]
EEIREENIMKRKEAQLKSKQRLSMSLILLGILFCLTIIGLPVGAVLIYLATRIAPDPEDI